MNKDTVIEAKAEVNRFLKRLEELEKTGNYKEGKGYSEVGYCPESAALRRASMDLTRSLAKLRKYRNVKAIQRD